MPSHPRPAFAVVVAISLLALVLPAVLTPPAAHAWKAGGHYTVAEEVAKQLPAGAIKNAMNAEPGYWAYGSYGPDLGYGVVGTIWERAPWADKWHYQLVGTHARRLLQVALASGDQRKIAFAAGWLTHCAGDLAVHDMYVNGEAGGIFFDDASTIPQHALLETWADPYCWVAIAGHPESEYEIYDPTEDNSHKFYQHYAFDLDVGVRDMLSDVSLEVLGETPGSGEIDYFTDIIYDTLKVDFTGKTGVYHSYADAVVQLTAIQPNGLARWANVERSWDRSVQRSVELLTAAQSGDYSQFTDCWNLDVGERDPHTICTLTVRVHTKDEWLAGTDDDVYFALKHDDDWLYMKLLDKPNYNDFEQNDTDDYYIYVSDPNFNPDTIKSCWLYKSPDGIGGGWRPEWITVWANGYKVVDQAGCPKWLEGDEYGRWWGVDADWSWILPPPPPPPPPPPEKPHAVAGDWDGDGCEDLAQFVADAEGATSLWLYTVRNGRFEVSNPWSAASGWNLRLTKEAVGDFDADGKDEIAVLYDYGGWEGISTGLFIWHLDGASPSAPRVWTAGSGWNWASSKITGGDFDGDGRDEVGFLYDYAGYSGWDVGLWSFELTTAGEVDQQLLWTAPDGTFDWAKSKLTSGDYDGDGKAEFGVLYNEGGGLGRDVSFRQIDTNQLPIGRYDSYLTSDRHIYWANSSIVSGDIRDDGCDDLMLLYKDDIGTYAVMWWALENHPYGSNFWVYWNCPPGTWLWESTRPLALDADGDGKDEVAAFYDYGGWSGVDVGLWYWPLHSMQDADQPLYLWTKRSGDWTLGDAVESQSDYLDAQAPAVMVTAPAWAWARDLRVSWTGADEANGSGMGSCQVAVRDYTDGSDTVWQVIKEFGDTSAVSYAWAGAAPGRRYVLRVRGMDRAGNIGTWRYAEVRTPHDQKSATFAGTWSTTTNAKLYMGSSRSSSAKGATARFSYRDAKTLKVLVTKRPTGGYADVYVNGKLVKRNVSLYARTTAYRVWVTLKSFSVPTSGTVKVMVKHAKAAASTGYRVEVDGLLAGS